MKDCNCQENINCECVIRDISTNCIVTAEALINSSSPAGTVLTEALVKIDSGLNNLRNGFKPKGKFVLGSVYAKNDLVLYNGDGYVSIVDNNISTPTEDMFWVKVVERGGQGNGITSIISNEDYTFTIFYEDGNSFTTQNLQGEKGDTFTYEDMTPEQLETLKGDVIAYNSLTESDKQDLANRVPALGVVQDNENRAVSGNEVYDKTITGENKVALESTLTESSNLIPDDTYFQNRLLTQTGTYPTTTSNAVSIKHFDINDYKGQNIIISGLGGLGTNRARYVILNQNNVVVQTAMGLGASNTNNVIVNIPVTSDILTIALNVVESSGSGTDLINGTSPYPKQVMINVGSIALPFQQFGKYLDKEKIGIPTKYGKIYIHPDGNDAELGQSKTTPVKTFSRARQLLEDDGLLYMWGDFVSDTSFELSLFRNIVVPERERCRMLYGAVYNSGTLVSGYTRVYQTSHTSAIGSGAFFWQKDISDRNTFIQISDRLPIHKKKTHRLDHTRLYMASSIEEIENTVDREMYYKDTENNILYFSKVEGSDLSINPIIYPSASVLRGTNPSMINHNGIEYHFRALFTEGLSGQMTNCVFGYVNRDGAFMWNYTEDMTLYNCEACGCSNDGVNGHFSGSLIMYGLWAHDNTDDGESAHENCQSFHYGSLVEYNGNGITPATGGSTFCQGTLVRFNRNRANGNPWANNEEGTGYSSQGGFLHVIGGISENNVRNYNIQSGSVGRLDSCVSKSPVTSHISGGGSVTNINFIQIN